MKTIPVRKISKEKIDEENFSIRKVENLLDGKNLFQELHRHDFYFLLSLGKGIGSHNIEFIPYALKDNSVYIMRPGQVHELNIEIGSTGFLLQFNFNFIYFNNKDFEKTLQKASTKNEYLLNEATFAKINNLLDNIYFENQDKNDGFNEIIKSYLSVLFIELLREKKVGDTSNNSTYNYNQERLEELILLIEQNLSEHKQVSFYADRMHLSNYQLNTITKTTLNKTVSDMINDSIILESKRYLLATNNQINQIAYQLGYEDLSYFIRFFKKHTGYTPEKFRLKFK